MGFRFSKSAVVTMVVMMLVFSVIHVTGTNEGLGLRAEEAKDAAHRATDATVDSAKSTKDKITEIVYDMAQRAKDGADHVMDAAYETSKNTAGYVNDSANKTAESAKDGAGYVKDKAKDGAGYVKDVTYGKTQLGAKEGGEDTLEWAKEKAKQGFEKVKNVMGIKYEEEAEPQKQQGSFDEEL
uniref:late embryogenesis abundant protein D-29-like n=1 Tax=Erigeron canadensis TaxID=72917 RepID=UPI001CB8980B|nr:late embryogenesis abundant protein D-29-like [Erigeron canadensis]